MRTDFEHDPAIHVVNGADCIREPHGLPGVLIASSGRPAAGFRYRFSRDVRDQRDAGAAGVTELPVQRRRASARAEPSETHVRPGEAAQRPAFHGKAFENAPYGVAGPGDNHMNRAIHRGDGNRPRFVADQAPGSLPSSQWTDA